MLFCVGGSVIPSSHSRILRALINGLCVGIVFCLGRRVKRDCLAKREFLRSLKEGIPWRKTSKCARQSPDRTLDVLLGAVTKSPNLEYK